MNFTDLHKLSSDEIAKINPSSVLEGLRAEKAERDFLHSADFPVQFLRPVPNLNQMMIQLTPVLGDPGTGFQKFGPKSPQKSVFVERLHARGYEVLLLGEALDEIFVQNLSRWK